MKSIILVLFIIQVCRLNAQDLQHDIMVSAEQDTVTIMTDYLPSYIKNIPWKSDTPTWDLNGLKAPFIRRVIALKPESTEIAFAKKFTSSIPYDQGTIEHFQLNEGTLYSLGESGKNLFGNSKLYSGYYLPKRPYHNREMYSGEKQKINLYKMVYDCNYSDIPLTIKNQFPYQPDSIRVVIEISEQSEKGDEVNIYLNLNGYKAIPVHKFIVQKTCIQTRKSDLAWQDVTRFIKYSKLFHTDTIRKTIFFADSTSSPIACIYYQSPTEIQKIIYKAPDTFKDLPIIEDYKPNLFFFPNPYTTGSLRCELLIKTPGLYTFRIVNIVGAEIRRENLYLDAGITIDKDLTYLTKGTYFITLEQDKDHVISTKRLYVIKS